MRVLVGFIHYESNCFSPLLFHYRDFQVVPAEKALNIRLGISGALLQGIVDRLRKEEVEILPTTIVDGVPGGLVSRTAYQRIKTNFLREVRKAGAIDGVCLGLHGSNWVERIGHAEGDLVASLRKILGNKVPIVAGLDLHGTLTPKLLRSASALVYYRTAPHADQFQTGQRTASLLLRILSEKVKPVMQYARLPIIVTGEQSMTTYEPMSSIYGMLDEIDAKPGILSSSIAMGNYWIDAPETGVTPLVISDGNAELAKREANRLATAIWRRRDELRFLVDAFPMDEALDAALKSRKTPVFVSDIGDNSTGGGSTDVPLVVERLIAKGAKDAVVAAIHDRQAMRACVRAGAGSNLTVSIGGKVDKRNGKPLRVTGRVKLLSDGEYYHEGERRDDMRDSMGRVAVLGVDGIDVILTEKRIAVVDSAQLRSLGIEPKDRRIIVVKLGYIWPALRPDAGEEIFMIGPGATDIDFKRLGFKKIRRPIFPFDPNVAWSPEGDASQP